MPTVSNSSPLIALKSIEQLDLLPALFSSILIPASVAAEIQPSLPVRPPWLELRPLRGPVASSVTLPSLGSGEREAISLGLELTANLLILDDRPARRVAESLGLTIIGTLGILLRAKRHGFLELVRPSLDALIAQSFFVSPRIYREVLDLANEHDSLP